MGKEQCAVTWEPAQNVPNAVIEEFERGSVAVVTDHVTPSGIGQTTHTLTVSPSQSPSTAVPRGPLADRPVIKESEGYVKLCS